MGMKDAFIKGGKWLETGSNFQMAVVSMIMIFRPLIMLTDTAVPMKTRQYAATREFFTELFGLTCVALVAKNLERFVVGTYWNKAINAGEKIVDEAGKSIGNKVKRLGGLIPWTKASKELNTALKHITKKDWKELGEHLKVAKGAHKIFGGWGGTVLATAIITPFLNNIVINDKVLNGIWKALGQGSITPNSSGAHGGPPKLDTPNLAAERMMALMGRVNPSQTLNMYQNSQYTPYSANFSGVQKTPSINPLARI